MGRSVAGAYPPHGRILAIGRVVPASRAQVAVRHSPAWPLDVASVAPDAVGCEHLAPPRWHHLPSPALVPHLEGVVTQVALSPGRSNCGQGRSRDTSAKCVK
jgi:hypothetical protein